MSHTGKVLKPSRTVSLISSSSQPGISFLRQERPVIGLVRIVTLGHAVLANRYGGSLIFSKSPELDSDLSYKEIMERMQNIFVLFYLSEGGVFNYGDGVTFNLRYFKFFEVFSGFPGEKDLKNLKEEIPNSWIRALIRSDFEVYKEDIKLFVKQLNSKDGEMPADAIDFIFPDEDHEEVSNPSITSVARELKKKVLHPFSFKYLITKMKKLPNKAVVNSMYNYTRDLSIPLFEEYLRKDTLLSRFRLQSKMIVKIKKHRYFVNEIRYLSNREFRDLYLTDEDQRNSNVVEGDYQDNIDQEIKEQGEHIMSSQKEIPIRCDLPLEPWSLST